MLQSLSNLLLATALGILLSACATSTARKKTSAPVTAQKSSSKPKYVLQISEHAFAPIYEETKTLPATMEFIRWRGDKAAAVFKLNNPGNGGILVWNVRLQILTKDPEEPEPSWKTVHNDYPEGELCRQCPSRSAHEFGMLPPPQSPWRLCLVYSREGMDSKKGKYYGNYEIIGPVIRD